MPTSQFPNTTGSTTGSAGKSGSDSSNTDLTRSSGGTTGSGASTSSTGSSSSGSLSGSGSTGSTFASPSGTMSATGATTGKSSSASSSTPDLNADAHKVMDEAKSVAGKVTEEAQQQASQLVEGAKAQVAETVDKVKGMAADQKDALAGQIEGVADAMDRVASELEDSNTQSARYARLAADNAQKLSGLVRDKDVDQLMAMAQDFGRRQPVVFVGAALLLGFAASRFLTASAQRATEATTFTGTESEPSTEDFMPSTTSSSSTAGAPYSRGGL